DTPLPVGDPPAAEVDRQLRIEQGPHDVGKKVRLSRRGVVIGRESACDLFLNDETKLTSRRHCAVVWNEESGRHELLDFGAPNGMKLNGRLIRGIAPLVDGDRIQIAGYTLLFETGSADY